MERLFVKCVLARRIIGFYRVVFKPFISAKIFGTLLYTTFYIVDGG